MIRVAVFAHEVVCLYERHFKLCCAVARFYSHAHDVETSLVVINGSVQFLGHVATYSP